MELKPWLKGTLPGWLVSLLFVYFLWSANNWIDRVEKDREEFAKALATHDTSIRLVEGKIAVLERGQDMVLVELKEIRRVLVEQNK